jgi:hypothetical protein
LGCLIPFAFNLSKDDNGYNDFWCLNWINNYKKLTIYVNAMF